MGYIRKITPKWPKTITYFNSSLHQTMFGVFSENFAIYTPQKPNIYIYFPYLKKQLGPIPAWALGRRTPGRGFTQQSHFKFP